MPNNLKVQNFYYTNVTSESIPSSGAFTFNVAVAPSYQNWFVVISAENTLQREIVYFHSVSGNTISVRAENRWLGGTSAKEHTQGESITMRDVAEIFNFYSDAVSTCFFVEKTGWLTVKVWWWTVYYNAAPQDVADTSLTLTDNVTNYIKYDFATNTISSGTVNSGNVKAIAVVVSGVIVSIAYKTAKETFIDYTVVISDALPSQTGNAGKSLTTDGTAISWQQIIPVQTGNAGKVLGTDGTTASWWAGAIASITIAGAVEIATDAEFDAGTVTGWTWSILVWTTLQWTRKISVTSGNDGADWALSISSGTTTIATTNWYVEKFYTDLTISWSATLNFSWKTTNWLVAIINVSWNFTMSGGTIDISWQWWDAEVAWKSFLYWQNIWTAPTVQAWWVWVALPIWFLAYKFCWSGGASAENGWWAGWIWWGLLIIRVKWNINFTGWTINWKGSAWSSTTNSWWWGGGWGGMVLLMWGFILANTWTINIDWWAGWSSTWTTGGGAGGGGGLCINDWWAWWNYIPWASLPWSNWISNTYWSWWLGWAGASFWWGWWGGGAWFKYVGKHLI